MQHRSRHDTRQSLTDRKTRQTEEKFTKNPETKTLLEAKRTFCRS